MKNYFDGINTMDALRAEYKRLVKNNHPDCGGDEATMKEINGQYEKAVEWIKAHGEQAEQAKAAQEVPADFIRACAGIIGLHGLVVDLVGCWLWVTGETYANKDALKAAGFRFAAKKAAWYWHPADEGFTHSSGKSLAEIKDKYGYQRLSGVKPEPEKLAAASAGKKSSRKPSGKTGRKSSRKPSGAEQLSFF